MDPAPPAAAAGKPAGSEPPLFAAWPRSAQLAAVYLLGLATGLLGFYVLSYSGRGSRPSELTQGYYPELAPPPRAEAPRPVIRVGEGTTVPELPPAAGRARTGKEAALAGRRIDVNRASVQELQLLPGIGPAMSQRIADERARAPFRSPDDLRRVPGIGPKTMEKLRPFVYAGGAAGPVVQSDAEQQ